MVLADISQYNINIQKYSEQYNKLKFMYNKNEKRIEELRQLLYDTDYRDFAKDDDMMSVTTEEMTEPDENYLYVKLQNVIFEKKPLNTKLGMNNQYSGNYAPPGAI